MDVLILRLIHIVAGAFWVGAVFTNAFFLQPTAMALGPEAAKFQYHLGRHRHFSRVILASGATTVLAGIWLLWITTNGLDADLMFRTPGLGFTVGGVAAILTFTLGSTYVYPRTERVIRIMSGVMSEGRGPNAEEQARLGQLRGELIRAGWVVVVGLAIAIASMATARHWSAVL
jgi:uncharacterized membrane protein